MLLSYQRRQIAVVFGGRYREQLSMRRRSRYASIFK